MKQKENETQSPTDFICHPTANIPFLSPRATPYHLKIEAKMGIKIEFQYPLLSFPIHQWVPLELKFSILTSVCQEFGDKYLAHYEDYAESES